MFYTPFVKFIMFRCPFSKNSFLWHKLCIVIKAELTGMCNPTFAREPCFHLNYETITISSGSHFYTFDSRLLVRILLKRENLERKFVNR